MNYFSLGCQQHILTRKKLLAPFWLPFPLSVSMWLVLSPVGLHDDPDSPHR